ncbi:MAG TPA: cytochrome c biogenesis heme-transporting ATPase CcmA [Woeseiaceae bacterium]|nr:cytochrome c biogenesis heme-transporting ATPase CcmA [Woeseiaceae bacterium]
MTTTLLEGRGLGLVRGDRWLFGGVDIALGTGELLRVEGPNGSGKTSLLRAVAGLIEPDDGEVLWRGQPIRRHRQAYHAELAWMGHRPGFKGDLTPVENLRFEAGLRAGWKPAADDILQRLGLTPLRRIPYRLLSAGQQRRLALARLVLSGATLWILDEPFTNLDAPGREQVQSLLDEHLAGGGVALAASHQELAIDAPTQRIGLQ